MIAKNLGVEFRKNPVGIDIKRPRFSWEVEASESELQNGFFNQIGYRIHMLKENEIFWDSGDKLSNQINNIEYNGPDLAPFTEYIWKVKIQAEGGEWSKWSEISKFVTGAFTIDDLSAQWILDEKREFEPIKIKDSTKSGLQTIKKSNPSPYLRKRIVISEKIKRAYCVISALGYYEAYINGTKIGDSYLTPEWTDYNKRILYQMFDVTHQLSIGENVAGAMLADGWYMGLLGPGDEIRQHYYGTRRAFYFQLIVEYESGVKEEFVSDNSWKIWADGPIRSADNFMGEEHDARLEIQNWNTLKFVDSAKKWKNTEESSETIALKHRMRAQIHNGIKQIAVFKPKSIQKHQNGTYIVNFGQNLVGFCRFEWEGSPGDTITIRHGEMLELDGSLHTDNLRLAQQKDVFIHDGKGKRIFQPRFTFHGFQYAELSGNCDSILNSIEAIAISSVEEIDGRFSCSDSLLNQIWNNVLWTQRDNMVSIPTDCPQRNERMGWMGDALIFAQTGIYNANLASFFEKFNKDIMDGQTEDGRYPDFAPHPMGPDKFTDAPGWADCALEIPWRCYLNYGNRKIITQSLAAIEKHFEWVMKKNPDLIWVNCGNKYGDWLNGDNLRVKNYPKKGGKVPFEIFSTMNLYRSIRIFETMNRIIGKNEAANKYSEIAKKIKEIIFKKFIDKKGKIKGSTQAGYALAYDFNILDETHYDSTKKHLLKALKRYKGRLSTGFFSTKSLLNTLKRLQLSEIAYKLIESKEFPSWGYSIEQGATTIWERWDAYVKGRGFQSKGMNSFNHYAYGSVVEFFYSSILGILPDPEKPGYEHIIFEPCIDPSLSFVEGSYHSIRGAINVSWKKGDSENGNAYQYNFEIPPNTIGTLKFTYLQGEKCLIDSFQNKYPIKPEMKEIDLRTGKYSLTLKK